MQGFSPGLVIMFMALGCTDVDESIALPSGPAAELPEPPRDVQRASLELRSALTLDARVYYEFLLDANVKGIFGPGTPIPKAAAEVMDIIDKAV